MNQSIYLLVNQSINQLTNPWLKGSPMIKTNGPVIISDFIRYTDYDSLCHYPGLIIA